MATPPDLYKLVIREKDAEIKRLRAALNRISGQEFVPWVMPASMIARDALATLDECRVCGRQIKVGELCDDCAKGNDPFFVCDNCGKDMQR